VELCKGYVDLSMPKYVMKQLTRYAQPAPLKPQHCRFAPNPVTYGKDTQAPSPTDDSPLLDNAVKKRIQQIVGSFLYYAQAVNPTILMALSNIATQHRLNNSLTTCRHTPAPSYITAPWTWYSTSTLMRLISPPLKHKAVLVATSSLAVSLSTGILSN
jgi:hypothetical protein